VSVDEGVFHERKQEIDATTSELCEEKGNTIVVGQAVLQGRCASSKGCQRGLGFMLCGHKAIR